MLVSDCDSHCHVPDDMRIIIGAVNINELPCRIGNLATRHKHFKISLLAIHGHKQGHIRNSDWQQLRSQVQNFLLLNWAKLLAEIHHDKDEDDADSPDAKCDLQEGTDAAHKDGGAEERWEEGVIMGATHILPDKMRHRQEATHVGHENLSKKGNEKRSISVN